MFDAVLGPQIRNAILDVSGETLISQNHVRPYRVTTNFRANHATQHRTEWRFCAPRRITVPGVFVRVFRVAIKQQQLGVIRMARRNGMIFQWTKTSSESYVSGRRDVLITEE